MKAYLHQVRLAPKKMNLVASIVRRMSVEDALVTLRKLPKKGAQILFKVIHSAASNAEQNDAQKRSDLYIKELIVNQGPAYRRSIPMARGRARPFDKFTSHVSVKLGVSVPGGVALEEKGEKRTKDQKKKKKPLEAEKVEGPVVHTQHSTDRSTVEGGDPHAGGLHETPPSTASAPQQHHHSSRGE